MLDSVVGVFGDVNAAMWGLNQLAEAGWPRNRMSMKRVMDTSYRGFSTGKAIHTLMHSPQITRASTFSEDQGIPLVILRVSSDETNTAVEALTRVGAKAVEVVAATPARG